MEECGGGTDEDGGGAAAAGGKWQQRFQTTRFGIGDVINLAEGVYRERVENSFVLISLCDIPAPPA